MKIKILFSFFACIVLLFAFTSKTFAEVIHSFDTQILAHKDGSMDIAERILYDFEKIDRHGIYRYIPTFSKVGDLYRVIKIENAKVLRDGKSEKFQTTTDSEKIQFKIGDPDRTISGSHEYTVSYRVINGIGSNFETHDEIYWNATGNEWQVTIEKASAEVKTDFPANIEKSLCFTGSFGTKESDCQAENGVFTSSSVINPGGGLTVVTTYKVGTFPKSILQKDPPRTFGDKIASLFLKYFYIFYLLLNLVIPVLLIRWYIKNKNKKKYGPPSVNFETPEDLKGERLTPAEAGTIDTAKLEKDDVLATIFDLAVRKYLRLEESKTKRKLLPDSIDQKIIKLKEVDEKLNNFEKKLMDRLFRDGDEVKVSALKKDFYKTFQNLEEEIFDSLVKKGFYVKNPKNQKALLIILGFFALGTLNIILAIVLFFLGLRLNGRTSLGDEIDHKIDGLKLFLKSMNRNYKWQANKFYTVEQMIPYAVSLGYINEFMAQLKIIKPDYSPSWYSGSNFYVSYAGFYAGMSSSVTTSAPSSSSGGGGGGSSGGGGGGGGGGSW